MQCCLWLKSGWERSKIAIRDRFDLVVDRIRRGECSVDFVHYLYYVLNSFNAQTQNKGAFIWADTIKRFILDSVKEYCGTIEKICQSDKKILPAPLPPPSIAGRSTFLHS